MGQYTQSIGIPMIAEGETVTANFTTEVTAHLYWFNASAGDVITVEMVQVNESGGLDPYIIVLGPRGQLIEVDDDSGSVLFSARVADVTLPEDGGYFIIASTFAAIDDVLFATDLSEEEQEYTLTLSGTTAPVNMPDYEEGTMIYYAGDTTIGERFSGYSSREEPVYYVRFSANEGDVLDIALESEDFDTLVHVFGPEGHRLGVNDDSGISTDSLIEDLAIPADGYYLIMATDVGFARANDPADDAGFMEFKGGDFTLTISR
jgi:hypothetical protein